MRKDIAKVICERQRSGSRDKNPVSGFRRQFHPRMSACEDYEDFMDSHPSVESKTLRLGYEGRQFSDRLGAIAGLIRKNVGRKWDKVYSNLCKQVSPTGTVTEQHVHSHLKDFIVLDVLVNSSQELFMHSPYMGLVPLEDVVSGIDYYVCPLTGLIKKIKRKKKRVRKPQKSVEGFYREIEGECFIQMFGIWYRSYYAASLSSAIALGSSAQRAQQYVELAWENYMGYATNPNLWYNPRPWGNKQFTHHRQLNKKQLRKLELENKVNV